MGNSPVLETVSKVQSLPNRRTACGETRVIPESETCIRLNDSSVLSMIEFQDIKRLTLPLVDAIASE